mgnify:CR=1 FL=1
MGLLAAPSLPSTDGCRGSFGLVWDNALSATPSSPGTEAEVSGDGTTTAVATPPTAAVVCSAVELAAAVASRGASSQLRAGVPELYDFDHVYPSGTDTDATSSSGGDSEEADSDVDMTRAHDVIVVVYGTPFNPVTRSLHEAAVAAVSAGQVGEAIVSACT